ncbi:MAG: class I SAM-dependent DNA methyltransferase, partial [Synergistaceae bacterium]|nr:class I SAM-dependent DNA methyltransferase [Synergistaceae bacterium]
KNSEIKRNFSDKKLSDFVKRWRGRGEEKSEMQKFWLDFLESVCGVINPLEVIEFEKKVKDKDNHTKRIDAYIPSTKVLIEQKSLNVDLNKKIPQSDGESLTPFEQAKRYYGGLPHFENPRWIIISNFKEFHIHDMDTPNAEPDIILLESLEKEQRKFSFLADPKGITPKGVVEEEISIKAGELVQKLKKSLKKRYKKTDDEAALKTQNESLTAFCVRIVFLVYAEDSGLFEKNQFYNYMKKHEDSSRNSLIDLFTVLSQKPEERNPYIDSDLAAFPYVNGGLFEKQDIEIPQIEGEPLEIILREMSAGFDWSNISPTIFGAIFEGVLDPDEQKRNGMHYTSVENIHKVIDPLFLDELDDELKNILIFSKGNAKIKRLLEFQEKLSKLRFLDPACGSGNFLTESFKSLRKLENQAIRELSQAKNFSDIKIKVKISQFYGIESSDFAVAVARTALWIANNQMLNEAGDLVKKNHLPLENYDNIKHGSAMDELEGVAWGLPGWKIYHEDMLYIIGNPPFLGYSQQDKGQKGDVERLLGSKKVDYVACWFAVASEYLQDKNTKAAFVATNSITQGEQVAAIFKPLHERWKIEIDFAYQSFVWNNEMQDKDKKAHVHVVVIGFSTNPPKFRKLYTSEGLKLVENINFYLKPGPNFFIESRKEPICNVPEITTGSMPADGGNLILTPEERDELLKANPTAEKFIRPFMGAEDFIQRKTRYCLWLVDAKTEELEKCPKVLERIKKVKEFRLASKRNATKKLADAPSLFAELRQPTQNYITIPEVSSEQRIYIPIGFMKPLIISSNLLKIIPDATLYHFGVLTSRVHMAWMRATAGRLEMRYRYSNTVVYNNFVWPSVNEDQKSKIETTAQKILDARAKYPDKSFADLYSSLEDYEELFEAHKENDAAVCEAYGFDKDISEEEIVSALAGLYEKITK